MKAKQGCHKRATRGPTWMVLINRPINQPINHCINQPIKHLLCFTPVGPCGWNHWWWGEPESDSYNASTSKGKSVFLYTLYPETCVNCYYRFFYTWSAILQCIQKNALPNSRDDDGCSKWELVECCGKGEKRIQDRSSSFCSNIPLHPSHFSWILVQPFFNFPLTYFLGITFSSCWQRFSSKSLICWTPAFMIKAKHVTLLMLATCG